MKEKKARVEDALHACRAAVEEGILPGGGVAVLRARKALDKLRKKLDGDEKRRRRHHPPRLSRPRSSRSRPTAASMARSSPARSKRADTNFGYNALTHEYGDLVKMGVIVPTKVERVALQNAASIAAWLCC
jgi:chaperonin GroEL